jgi:hypothetical protein
MPAQLADHDDCPLLAHADVHAASRKVNVMMCRKEPLISIFPSHRVSIRLSFSVSVYIAVRKHFTPVLTEENIRPIDSSAHRKAFSGSAFWALPRFRRKPTTHSSQYFTGLHNLTP